MLKNGALPFTAFRRLFLPRLKPIEIVLHPVGAVLLHLLGNVPVNVERKRRRSVADVGLYRLDVVAILEREHGEGVPHVVKADIRQADFLHDPLEVVVHRRRAGGC